MLVALLAASALGYWGYSAYRKRELQNTVLELVKNTSLRLRESLSIEAGAQSPDAAETVRKLDDRAQEVDRNLFNLRRMNAAPDRALVEAAIDYVVSSLQILRAQASSHRYRARLADSTRALRAHMRNANRRNDAWIRDALRAKDRAENDYFDYKLAVEAFGHLLLSFSEARTGIAARAGPVLLVGDDLVMETYQRALEATKQTADEMEKTRQLAAPR
ncbi:MAG: hypothetical protein WBM28_12025 [Burkholderiales bacterium]